MQSCWVGFPQGLSAGSEKPSSLERGLAAPWLAFPFLWTISLQHLSVCLLEYSFFNFLNDSNYFRLTQIYFPF